MGGRNELVVADHPLVETIVVVIVHHANEGSQVVLGVVVPAANPPENRTGTAGDHVHRTLAVVEVTEVLCRGSYDEIGKPVSVDVPPRGD